MTTLFPHGQVELDTSKEQIGSSCAYVGARVLTDLKLAGSDWFHSSTHKRAVDQRWI